MSNTVTVTKLLNTSKRDIIHVYVLGDGTGDETAAVIYDYSVDTYAPDAATKLWVEKMWASVDGTVDVDLSFGGSTPFILWGFPQYSPGYKVDLSCFGGIGNKAGTPSGDITMATNGLGAGDDFHFILDLRKA